MRSPSSMTTPAISSAASRSRCDSTRATLSTASQQTWVHSRAAWRKDSSGTPWCLRRAAGPRARDGGVDVPQGCGELLGEQLRVGWRPVVDDLLTGEIDDMAGQLLPLTGKPLGDSVDGLEVGGRGLVGPRRGRMGHQRALAYS